MPYRPSFDLLGEKPVSLVTAVVPASIGSAFIGTTCLGAYFLAASLPNWSWEPVDALGFLLGGGIALLLATAAATFITGWYLLFFGLPIAFLLGERIRHGGALAISMLVALAAAFFAVDWIWGWSRPLEDSPWGPLFTVLCFALPAGFLYRRSIIMMLDEIEVD